MKFFLYIEETCSYVAEITEEQYITLKKKEVVTMESYHNTYEEGIFIEYVDVFIQSEKDMEGIICAD